MRIRISKLVAYDNSKEEQRLRRVFKGKTQERMLEIFSAFMEGEFDRVYELYEKLPYNNEHECSEKEFTDPALMELVVKALTDWDVILNSK
jgi:hypothetical protein